MNQETRQKETKVILHAPTPSALERARRNAANIRNQSPEVDVRIVVNGEAVAAALDVVSEDMDALTWVCPNTLKRISRENRAPLQLMAGPAVLEIAYLQQAGWVYIRA
ncbi:DsrE family protein [Achromobacter aloeverae]